MNPAYREYFRQRLEQMLKEDASAAAAAVRGGLEPNPRAPFVARAAIEHARSLMPSHVDMRPDAEMLLYLLAAEFVAKPVLAMEPQGAIDLTDDLADDTARVLDGAARRAIEAPRGSPGGDSPPEVSAHQVVNALSDSWSDLRTARSRVWDNASGRERLTK